MDPADNIKYEVNGGSNDPLDAQSPSSENVASVQNIDDIDDDQSSTTTNNNTCTSKGTTTTGGHSILQLTIPAEVQSVIQPNQQSVIQSATNIQPVQIGKSNVILVANPGKTNSVIQTTQGNLQTVQVVDSSDDTLEDDDLEDEDGGQGGRKKRRGILTRRPSYRKILNELGGGEIAVIPASALQLNQSDGSIITTGVQYQNNEGQFYIQGGQGLGEDHARKREMRLMKNREAARECRRKKKEYIKCLENRVAVLENQNKALIDELKSLKELYCQQKIE